LFERRYFVVAPDFHGATLLAKLVNDHPEVVSLGDTYPSNRLDQVCGCGARVSACPFWQGVSVDVGAPRYRDHPHLLPDYPPILGRRLDRVLYNTLPPLVLAKLIPRARRRRFADEFEAFVAAVHTHGDRPEARVYVDGVKSISRVLALVAAGVRVDGVIHLYRHPRDYVQSAMKQKRRSRVAFLRYLLGWRWFHNRARRLGRYVPAMALRYEALADAPESSLARVFAFLGVPPVGVAALTAVPRSAPWHFMGNASLFHFDGRIERRRYTVSGATGACVRVLAGPYSDADEAPARGGDTA